MSLRDPIVSWLLAVSKYVQEQNVFSGSTTNICQKLYAKCPRTKYHRRSG